MNEEDIRPVGERLFITFTIEKKKLFFFVCVFENIYFFLIIDCCSLGSAQYHGVFVVIRYSKG